MSQCETCGAEATLQWLRRSTDEEWGQAVQLWRHQAREQGHPEDVFIPRDGLALRTVFGCDEHHPDDPTQVQA